MNNQKSIDGKAAYHAPVLTVFGALAAVTLSGAGTVVETSMTNMMVTTCQGGMVGAMRFPCQ